MIDLRKKYSGIIGIIIFLILTLSLTGCGAGRTMVLTPAETPAKFTSAEIIEDKPTVNVPGDVSASFHAKLTQLLYGQDGFTKGPGLKIKYRFIQYNPGSQFTRWFWGGLAAPVKAP